MYLSLRSLDKLLGTLQKWLLRFENIGPQPSILLFCFMHFIEASPLPKKKFIANNSETKFNLILEPYVNATLERFNERDEHFCRNHLLHWQGAREVFRWAVPRLGMRFEKEQR